MAISINTGLSVLPVQSSGNNRQRSFTSGQQFPVAGQPQALQNRPQQAPGIIPVPIPTPAPTVEKETGRDEELLTDYDITHLIVKKILLKNDDNDKQEVQPQKHEQVNLQTAPELNIPSGETQEKPQASTQSSSNPPSGVKKTDPLALDLDGNGLQVTGLHDGVSFDIDADGQLDQTSFISGNDAFLALDLNGNNEIDDGSELFGDQGGAANGYQALEAYDDNKDGRIDNLDAVFSELKLLYNSDGQLNTTDLSSSGIASISVNYQNTSIAINSYDSIEQISHYEKEDGSTGMTGDLLLAQKA